MALILYHHPLASFCHKVLLALYENEIPFEGRIVDLYDPRSGAELHGHWPLGKLPVLIDEERQRTIPETSIIIEYLDQHYPGTLPLVPKDPELALEARLWDRLYDLYVSVPMQKIVTDRLRAQGQKDDVGVGEAKQTLQQAYDLIEVRMATRTWTLGDTFSIADCSAAPALFYAEMVSPFSGTHPSVAEYFARLALRGSFTKVIEEAKPYFHLFPFHDQMPSRYRASKS